MSDEEEKPPPTYFCWVRVVDIARMTTPAPYEPFQPTPKGPIKIYHWDVPNKRITSAISKQGEGIGVWGVVDGFFGRENSDTAFDYGPAFVDQDLATAWIANTVEGRRWDKESLNRFLVRFELF